MDDSIIDKHKNINTIFIENKIKLLKKIFISKIQSYRDLLKKFSSIMNKYQKYKSKYLKIKSSI